MTQSRSFCARRSAMSAPRAARTAAEADASARELPAELGDADGEVIFAERLITIGASPGSGTGSGGGNSTPHKKPTRVPRGFGDVAASPDGRKLTPRNLDVVGDVGRWLKEVDADGSGEIDAGELQGWGCCPSHVCFCSDSPVLSTQILLLPLASHLAAAM